MSDYFPPEIIEKILLKLPVKSLIRFTTVCKSWRSIITNPSFISSHHYKPPNRTLLLRRFNANDRKERYSLLEVDENKPFRIDSSTEFKAPFISESGFFGIVGSCRGVVMLRHECEVLWNPCVGKYVVLPKTNVERKDLMCSAVGFGYADGDFKVVRLFFRLREGDYLSLISPPEAEVYSLRTGRWRSLGVVGRFDDVKGVRSTVFLNGVVHWLGHRSIGGDCHVASILTFRVAQEVFDEIRLPDELERKYLYLISIGESLAVVSPHKYRGNGTYDVWLMERYGDESSWTRLYNFELMKGLKEVISIQKNGEVLVAIKGIGLVAFDLESLETKNLGIQGDIYGFSVNDYVESLELMNVKS